MVAELFAYHVWFPILELYLALPVLFSVPTYTSQVPGVLWYSIPAYPANVILCWPLTSNLYAGLVVPIPILVPSSYITLFSSALEPLNLGI